MWRFKILFLFMGMLALPIFAFSQSVGDYQTTGTGNGTWEDLNSWSRWNGSSWVSPAPSAPISTDGAIAINHNISVNSSKTLDQVSVITTVTLTVSSSGTLIISNGTGTDLTVSGTGFLDVSGIVTLNNLATITGYTGTNFTFQSGSTYRHLYTTTQGAVPLAVWSEGSTAEVAGYTNSLTLTAAGNWSQSFSNFTFNCTSLANRIIDFQGLLNSIGGNLTISNTGTTGVVRLSQAENPTINIGGNLNVSNAARLTLSNTGTTTILNITGNLNFTSTNTSGSTTNTTGSCTINLTGDLVMNASGGFLNLGSGAGTGVATLNLNGNINYTAGTFRENSSSTGNGVINFIKPGTQNYTGSGTFSNRINCNVASGTILNLGTSAIAGSGAFTLNTGAELQVGSTNSTGAIVTGTTLGNIRTSGTRTYNSGSTITYNGLAAQFLGNGHPTTNGVNANINNSNGVTLTANRTVGGDLTLTNGNLNLGTGGFRLTIGSALAGTGEISHVSGNIVPNLSGTSSITLIGASVSDTVSFGSNSILTSFIINRSGGSVTLMGNLRTIGTLTQTAGDLVLNGNKLWIAAAYTRTSGNIVTSSTSTIETTGAGTLNPLVLSGGTLKTFIHNRTNTWNTVSNLTIIDTLTLSNGAFGGTGTITISDSATIYRALGTTTKTITAVGVYNLTYDASTTITTGNEIPISITALNNLTIEGTGIVNLNKAITINGNCELNGSAFDTGVHQVTFEGNLLNGSTSDFSTSNIIFAGNTTISGGVAPTFVAITINPSSTLNLGAGTVNFTGNITNNGTLSGGTSTANFTGNSTIDGTGTNQTKSTGAVSVKGSLHNVAIAGTLAIDCSTCGNVQNSFGINISGNFTYTSGTFTPNESLIDFNGSSTQTITASSISFNSIDLSGSNSVNLGSDLNVTNKLFIGQTATLNTTGSDFGVTLGGDFFINGTFTGNQSLITLNGSLGDQTIDRTAGSSTINFYDITVNKSAGNVLVETNCNLENSLSINSATEFDADGASGTAIFTLLSNATRTAAINQLFTGASISGSATVQRFLSNANDTRAYRFLGSPTINSFVSDWQNEIPITGSFSNYSTGIGIDSSAASMFYYNEPTSKYVAYPSSGNSNAAPLVNGRGYSIYVRDVADLTLDTRGAVGQGDVNLSLTDVNTGNNALGGWNLISNPYPANIGWSSIAADLSLNINDAIYLKDNTNIGNTGAGQYITYIDGVGVPASYDGVIGQSQAFWVNVINNVTLTINEADKTASSAVVYSTPSPLVDILRIHVAGGNNKQDETVIRFKEGATLGLDNKMDAQKLGNDFINLSTKLSNRYYTVNTLPFLVSTQAIPLVVNNFSTGTYYFTFSGIESFGDSIQVTLRDNFLNTTVVLTSATQYQFLVTTSSLSKGENRFVLNLIPSQVQNSSLSKEEILGLNVVLKDLTLYPNPTSGLINLGGDIQSVKSISVYNLTGILVKELSVEKIIDNQIDISELNAGIYIVILNTDNGRTINKIIKN